MKGKMVDAGAERAESFAGTASTFRKEDEGIFAAKSFGHLVDQVAADTVIEAIKLARHDPEELRRSLDEQVDPAELMREMEPLLAAPALLYSITTAAAYPSGTAVGLDLRTQDGRWWPTK